MSTDEFEASFDETFGRVLSGESAVVMLDGEPAAIVLHPDDPLVDWLCPDGLPGR